LKNKKGLPQKIK